ncbi:MAG: aminotransferase class I/II-fold pyridoxal phosphate-dependent enzyme [Arcticibacter sp.]
MSDKSEAFFLDGKAGRTAHAAGRQILFFSGYNYLGLSHQEEFVDLVAEGMAKFGWLFPSSRISNTRLKIFEECEALLSAITGSEDTVLLPSGFAAGQLATANRAADLFNAPQSHPAIARNSTPYTDFAEWSAWLVHEAEIRDQDKPLAIASDSLSPLTATMYDFSFVSEIRQPVNVIIDDSHGIGLIGAVGRGVSSKVPRHPHVHYTFTYSLSKAFGITGGAISCSRKDADRLRNSVEYTSVSPLSPGLIYAFIRGQHIYAAQRAKLQGNITRLAELTHDLPGLKYNLNFPVFILPAELDEKFFDKHNILISAFAYPDPSGPSLKRVVLNALHTNEDLETLAQVLREAYREKQLI